MLFEHPEWAFLLLLVPLIVLWRWRLSLYRKATLTQLSLRSDIIRNRSPTIYLMKSLALCAGWIFLALALMGPQGNPQFIYTEVSEEKAQRQEPQEVIFFVDASASMGVLDGRRGVSRFDVAKELVELLVLQLKGQNVSLYAFTSEAIPLSPPTLDYLFVILALREMKINEGEITGTNLSSALSLVLKETAKDHKNQRYTVVIVSDGGDDSQEKTSAPELLEQVKTLSGQGWNFYLIGVGTPEGGIVPDVTYQGHPVISKLNEQLLQQIAEASHGHYYTGQSSGALQLTEKISREILHPSSQRVTASKHSSTVIYQRYFQIPLIGALLCLLFVLLYPDSEDREHG